MLSPDVGKFQAYSASFWQGEQDKICLEISTCLVNVKKQQQHGIMFSIMYMLLEKESAIPLAYLLPNRPYCALQV